MDGGTGVDGGFDTGNPVGGRGADGSGTIGISVADAKSASWGMRRSATIGVGRGCGVNARASSGR